jgi:hypothetical protein
LRYPLSIAALLLPLTTQAASSCPSSFEKYLTRFQRDSVFQKEHRHTPLRYSFVDAEAEPEPRTVQRQLSAVQAEKQPLIRFPSADVEKTNRLERKVAQVNDQGYVVRFDQPDSDRFSIEFHFSRIGRCWRLVEVNDLSL